MEKPDAGFTYSNGKQAFQFMPDGSGFLVYPSGRPAVCISTVSAYQNRYYVYDDAPTPRALKPSEVAAGMTKEHLLCALDENCVGYAVDNSSGKQHGMKVVFTKTGCLVADSDGRVAKQWKWDQAAQNAGTPPKEPLKVKLNTALTLTFEARHTIELRFSCEGCVRVFDLGVKAKRTVGSYLETAVPVPHGPRGKLSPRGYERHSIAARHQQFTADCAAKRDLLKPKASNLGRIEGTVDLVARLEESFDAYSASHNATCYLEPSWRGASEAATRAELPPIVLSGAEVPGPVFGLGSSLYVTPEDYAQALMAEKAAAATTTTATTTKAGAFDTTTLSSTLGGSGDTTINAQGGGGGGMAGSFTQGSGSPPLGTTLSHLGKSVRLDGIPDHLRNPKTGAFKSNFDVRLAIAHANPLLPRTSLLTQSSGRYADDLMVPGGTVSALNPTGKVEPNRARLLAVKGHELDGFLTDQCPLAQVVGVVCVRADDKSCRTALAQAEMAQAVLERRGNSSSNSSSSELGPNADAVLAADAKARSAAALASTLRSSSEYEGRSEGFNATINGGGSSYDPASADARLVVVDLTESRWMEDQYGIRTVPFLLCFTQGGKLVYGGTLGGTGSGAPPKMRPLPGSLSDNAWRVLLIEPDPREQVLAEGVLRKAMKKDRVLRWDLCLSAADSVARRANLAQSSSSAGAMDYDLVLIASSLSESDVVIVERAFKAPLSGKSSGGGGGAGPMLVGMADVRAAARSADGHMIVAGGEDSGGGGAYERLAQVKWAAKLGNGKCITLDPASRRVLLPSERHANATSCCLAKPLASKHLDALGDLLTKQRRAAAVGSGGNASMDSPTGSGWSARSLLQALIQGGNDGRRGHFVAGCVDLGALAGAQANAIAGLKARKHGDAAAAAGGGVRGSGETGGGDLALSFGFTLPGQEASWRGTKLDRSGLLEAGGAT